MKKDEFHKAVNLFGILTKTSKKDLKKRYLKLSKKYHPDMNEGEDVKFKEIKAAYELLLNYIENYQFSFEEEEFKKQYPAFSNYKNWKI